MARHIKTKKGLETLKARYLKAGASAEWVATIEGCLEEGLAMDETDWENTPDWLRKLWGGLR